MPVTILSKKVEAHPSFAYNQSLMRLESDIQVGSYSTVTARVLGEVEVLGGIPTFVLSESIVASRRIYTAGTSLFIEIMNLYEIENEEEIISFLMKNIFLLPLLKECYDKIQEVFGFHEVRLELFSDPEEDFEELFIAVLTAMSPEESLSYLNKFNFEYFLGINHKTQGNLNVRVELI